MHWPDHSTTLVHHAIAGCLSIFNSCTLALSAHRSFTEASMLFLLSYRLVRISSYGIWITNQPLLVTWLLHIPAAALCWGRSRGFRPVGVLTRHHTAPRAGPLLVHLLITKEEMFSSRFTAVGCCACSLRTVYLQ